MSGWGGSRLDCINTEEISTDQKQTLVPTGLRRITAKATMRLDPVSTATLGQSSSQLSMASPE